MRITGQGPKTLLLTSALLVLLLSACADEPPLPPVSLPESLPRSMKGYELYSWRSGGAWRFTLITGTNRLKTIAEITSLESTVEGEWVKVTVEGVPELKAVLDRLPSGAHVGWWGKRDLPPGFPAPRARLALPPRSAVQEVQAHCSERGIELAVTR